MKNVSMFKLLERINSLDEWDSFIYFATRMHFLKGMKTLNSALAFVQRPGACFIETERRWLVDHERKIKPTSTPIIMLVPSYPVGLYYDAEDTFGDKPLPKYMQQAFCMPDIQPLSDYKLDCFVRALFDLGINYEEKPLGSSIGGKAVFTEGDVYVKIYNKNKKKFEWMKTYFTIVVNSNLKDAQKACVIMHEIGHILCGHLGTQSGNKILSGLIPLRDQSVLTENLREYEAEKVCQYASSLLSIDSKSERYLNMYQLDFEENENYSKIAVQNAACLFVDKVEF